jgi:hypothetical protein
VDQGNGAAGGLLCDHGQYLLLGENHRAAYQAEPGGFRLHSSTVTPLWLLVNSKVELK